ncbi:thiol-disulfide oxidoreductase DCC family protein [Chitinolyticbacter albus]|uniref:thiol-disulfide oxidoreductase DCC family protein n=1 Tax=Chitinolyticbacter albus TaxID=2961951 RepID=UPI00210D5AAD|nr:DCC1-like thiol-disulfide oxidoreductase family protein [Chitinolyticbacter albus]
MLIAYYDGSCPFCSQSMYALRRRAPDALQLVDAADPAFDAAQSGHTRAELMHSLHVQDAAGTEYVGVAAVCAVFKAARLGWLVWPLRLRALQPLWFRAYALLARQRYRLSQAAGLDCPNGTCTLDPWRWGSE